MESEIQPNYVLKDCCIACLTEKGYLKGDPVTIACYKELIDKRIYEKATKLSILFCKYCQEVLEQFKDYKAICRNAMVELEKRLRDASNGDLDEKDKKPDISIVETETKYLPPPTKKPRMSENKVDLHPKVMLERIETVEMIETKPELSDFHMIEYADTEPIHINIKEEVDALESDEGVGNFEAFDDYVPSSDEDYLPEEEKTKATKRKTPKREAKAKSVKKTEVKPKVKTEKPKKVTGIKKLMEKALDKVYTNTREDKMKNSQPKDDEEGGWWDNYWEQDEANADPSKNDDDKSKKKKTIPKKKKSKEEEEDSESDAERPQESNEPIWCNYCDEIFPSIHSEPNNYSTHVSTVHGSINDDGTIDCGICGKRMRQRNIFRRHFQNHRIFQTPKRCPKAGCTADFMTMTEYKSHKKQHNIRRAECPHCDFTCRSKDFIKSHIIVKHQNGVWCKYCRHGVPWEEWEAHEKWELERKSAYPDQTYMCEHCGMMFKSKESKRVHIRGIHAERECACEQCGNIFRSMLHLRRHVLYNHAEKKYECDICNKKIRQKSHLKKHMEFNHMADRYTTCDICGQTVYKRGLPYHIKTVHAEHKVFECIFCKRRFGAESSLKQHVGKKHGSQKPLPCPLCPRGYFSVAEYRKHMQNAHDDPNFIKEENFRQRITKNENGTFDLGHVADMSCMFGDFACKICGKKYNILYSLRDHMHQHPECMPFRCDMCDKVYFLENQLSKHYEKTHKQTYIMKTPHQPVKFHSIAEKVLEFTIVNGDIETCTRRERKPRKKYPPRRKVFPPDHIPRPNPTRLKNMRVVKGEEPSTSYEDIEILEEANVDGTVEFGTTLLKHPTHHNAGVALYQF